MVFNLDFFFVCFNMKTFCKLNCIAVMKFLKQIMSSFLL